MYGIGESDEELECWGRLAVTFPVANMRDFVRFYRDAR
jgi:hypothetical protein